MKWREGELLSECDQGTANQWNMAFFDQEDVAWWNRPYKGPELRCGRFCGRLSQRPVIEEMRGTHSNKWDEPDRAAHVC